MSAQLWLRELPEAALVLLETRAPSRAARCPYLLQATTRLKAVDARGLPTPQEARQLAQADLLWEDLATDFGGTFAGRRTQAGRRTYLAWFPALGDAQAAATAGRLSGSEILYDPHWSAFAHQLCPPLSWWVDLLKEGGGNWILTLLAGADAVAVPARRAQDKPRLQPTWRRWIRPADRPPDPALSRQLAEEGWKLLAVDREASPLEELGEE